MPVYRSSKKKIFIEELSEFILSSFHDDFKNLKVILPNQHLRKSLQESIVNKLGKSVINDRILSIDNLFLDDPSLLLEGVEIISNLEAKIILLEIINSYNQLYSIQEGGISLTSSLIRLFFQFEANNINFNNLKSIVVFDEAEHWSLLYDFIEYSYIEWQRKLLALKKITPVNYQQLLLNSELTKIRKSEKYSIVVAGVIGNNQIIKDFIFALSKLKNGYIILPPFTVKSDKISSKVNLSDEPLFQSIAKLLDYLVLNASDIPYLGQKNRAATLDNFLVKSRSKKCFNDVEYIEFGSVLSEAEYVATKCYNLLKVNSYARIAILISEERMKNYFTAKLYKYGLNICDLLGNNLMELQLVSLILEIAKNISQAFCLEDFISIILHPLIICDETRKLKKLICKLNKFTSSIEVVSKIINENFNRIQSKKLHGICKIWTDKVKNDNFSILLNYTIKMVKIIYPTLSQDLDKEILALLKKIVELTKNIKFLEENNFVSLLKELILDIRVYRDQTNSIHLLSSSERFNYFFSKEDTSINKEMYKLDKKMHSNFLGYKQKKNLITICSANEAILLEYDLIIYTTSVLNSPYFLPQMKNLWLNKKTSEKIGLDYNTTDFEDSIYNCYLNLYNKNVLVTRSTRIEAFARSFMSPLLLNLKYILKHDFKKNFKRTFFSNDSKLDQSANISKSNDVFANYFPKRISATDIETLIQVPYNFYAKKILNLKVQQEIDEFSKPLEFGKFFHKVVEVYTRDSSSNQLIALNKFKQHAREIFSISIYPKQIKRVWLAKIDALAREFVEFDYQRRHNAQKVFIEKKGEIIIDTGKKEVKIVVIADRIEINKENKAIIMDYKTGTVPSKKNVLLGFNPQLIIESIVLLNGGFCGIESVETEKLVYVKINSKSPYISLVEIPIKKDDIQKHQKALTNLLNYYITNGKYPLEVNLAHHDAYWHLARRKVKISFKKHS